MSHLDYMQMQFGITSRQFCNLLEETIQRLIEALRTPGSHEPGRLEMARGALKILIKGPHFIPRERKMSYVDDLIHMLVAREALFRGEVKRSTFEALCVGVPEPPRKQLMELSTHIAEGAPGMTDEELIAGAQAEYEAIKWRNPARAALYRRVAGLAIVAVIFFVIYRGNLYLQGIKWIEPRHLMYVTGLAYFFVLAMNTAASIFFLREPPSKFGPPLVDLASEGSSQSVFIINGMLQHATDIYLKQPALAFFASAAGWGASLWVLWHGQKTVEWTIRTVKYYLWLFWRWMH